MCVKHLACTHADPILDAHNLHKPDVTVCVTNPYTLWQDGRWR